MKHISPRYSVRSRLLLLAIGVELVMLTLLVANSLRLLHGAMSDQTRWQVQQMMPVLNAALTAPLAQRDFATIQAILDESRATQGISYIVVVDGHGRTVAASGWKTGEKLPEPSRNLPLITFTTMQRYDDILPIVQSGQRLGNLHLGLDLSRIISARRTLLSQGIGIAALELALSTLILFLIGYWLTRHLSALTEASLRVASGNLTPSPLHEGDDDIGQLGKAFNTMSRVIADRVRDLTQAKEIAEANERAKSESEKQLAVKQSQLEALNRSLQQQVDETVARLRQSDQMLISQGRQAAMGEMIGNIAHQWRQPLNALSMLIANIQYARMDNELTAEYMEESVATANRLIQKMSSTINDFRNFFSPDKEKRSFSALQQIRQAVGLVEAALKSCNIAITIDGELECTLYGFPNEYSQVLLNLLSNAKEAIQASGALPGLITITLTNNADVGVVSIRDTGGGIPEAVLDKIFEPYFSTKSMGTGIGLYMSKMIIERNMDGAISAHNIEGGAEFVVSIPIAQKTSLAP